MSDSLISVTEAARNFAEFVNRAHYQNQSFTLLKNGVPFARIVPADQPMCRGADLAKVLAGLELSDTEAASWSRDLHDARKKLKPPQDKWE